MKVKLENESIKMVRTVCTYMLILFLIAMFTLIFCFPCELTGFVFNNVTVEHLRIPAYMVLFSVGGL